MLKNASPSALLLLLTLLEVSAFFLFVFAKIIDFYILILKSDS